MKLVIEDEDIQDVQNAAHDCCGLDLTKEQVLEILSDEHYGYAAEVYQYGATDTEVRSYLCRILVDKILPDRNWPTYAEPEEKRKQFFSDFENAARAAGYKVCD